MKLTKLGQIVLLDITAIGLVIWWLVR